MSKIPMTDKNNVISMGIMHAGNIFEQRALWQQRGGEHQAIIVYDGVGTGVIHFTEDSEVGPVWSKKVGPIEETYGAICDHLEKLGYWPVLCGPAGL